MSQVRKRANGEGAIVRIKAKGRKPYAAVVTVGWDLRGKPIRKARSASSMAEAKMLLSQMTEARDHHRPLPDDKLTVGKWLRLWLPTADVRPTTRVAYGKAISWALPVIGQIPLRRLGSSQVESYLAGLRNAGYAATTVAQAKGVLSNALRAAVRDGYAPSNVASVARLPRQERNKLPAPTTDEVRAVLKALEGHRLRPLYVLLAGTGLRIGEALGLRWEDLDGATLTVRYQLQRIAGEAVLTPPKTTGRTLALGPSVVAALREQKKLQAAEQIGLGRKWPDRGLVFTRPDGEPLNVSTAEHVLRDACQRAGVRHIRPHDIRRYVASELEDRIGRDAGQLVLGHTTPQMTAKYVSTRDSLLRRAADELSEAIG